MIEILGECLTFSETFMGFCVNLGMMMRGEANIIGGLVGESHSLNCR